MNSVFKYEFVNNKANRTIIFIHGLGCSSIYFKEIISELRNEYNYLKIDLIGHGDNSEISIDFNSIKTQAELINNIIQKEQLKNFIIVAHSMGSIVAFELNKLNKVSHIILLDGNIIEKDFRWNIELDSLSENSFNDYWEQYKKRYKTFLRLNLTRKLNDYNIYAEEIKRTNTDYIFKWKRFVLEKRNSMLIEYAYSFNKTTNIEALPKSYFKEKQQFCVKNMIQIISVNDVSHFFHIEVPIDIAKKINNIIGELS